MNKSLPDKWIRKAIFDAFNGTIIDGETVNVYDTFATTINDNEKAYILMSAQGNETDATKCEDFWESDILLEVCTWYKGVGNPGSRLLADNILESLRSTLEPGLDLTAGGLVMERQVMSFPNDIGTSLPNGTLFRKFLRLELRIK